MKVSEEVVLALCDAEEEYAGLMTEYMQRQGNLPWVVHAYTDVEKLKEKEKDVDVLVVAESLYQDELKTLSPRRLVVLNESGIIRNKNLRYVNKYQQADQVVRELLCIYLEIATQVLPRLGTEGKTRFLGFYSPVRRSLQTTFALTMAQLMAKEHKTLYLNFEYFAGNRELLADAQTRDLADLLYFLDADAEKFSLRLQSMVQTVGPLSYVPPMKSGQNLLGITAKDWLSLLKKLQELGEYEYVFLDLSECMQGLFDVLRVCSKIYLITQEDEAACGKLVQYEELLEQYSYQDILEKTKKQKLPRFRRLPSEITYYDRGELAEYVREQLRELFRDDEKT